MNRAQVKTDVLIMTFISEDGKKFNIRVPSPKADITAADVLETMNVVQETGIFGWSKTNVIESAKIVETITDNIDIEVSEEGVV